MRKNLKIRTGGSKNPGIIIGELILIGGKIGCFIFVILTGYFSTIHSPSIVMQGIKAWLAASFYGSTLAVIYKAMGEQIGIKDIVKGTLPIYGGGIGS